MAKAKNRDLKRATHKGRRGKTGRNSPKVVNNPRGTRATGLRVSQNRQLTTAALGAVSPTPHGPEPHWPAGY